MLKKVVEFLHAHPVVKSALVTVAGAGLGAAVVAAQAGQSPKEIAAAAQAGAFAALYALFVKRPQDGAGK